MDFNDLLVGDSPRLEKPSSKTTITIESVPTKDTIPTVVRVSKEEASKFNVGDAINLNLSGTIKSMRDASTNDQARKEVDIELAGPTISSVASNPADFEMAKMMDN